MLDDHITKRVKILEKIVFGRSVHPECSYTYAYIGADYSTQLCENPQNDGEKDIIDEPALPRCTLQDCPIMKGD